MDWKALKKLRQIFLNGEKSKTHYWESKELLQSYEETFAARIGWKWDSVLKEIQSQLQLPPSYTLVDWGAGTAIATRKFLSYFPNSLPKEILLIEKSSHAVSFSTNKIKEASFACPVKGAERIATLPENTVLLISHVLTELSEAQLKELIALANHAHTIIWVEPGTLDCGRKLGVIREKLLPRFSVLAPCTHNLSCPLLQEKHATDWCHHFADVPSEAFTTAHWKTFSKELGIDLRSLPTSYLAFTKSQKKLQSTQKRLIGRAKHLKGYSLIQTCSSKGIEEIKILAKNDKKLLKELKTNPFRYLID